MADKLKQLRIDLLKVSYEARACHIGSALSCLPILAHMFYEQKIKPEDFFFGKASGVGAYYVILADLGYFPAQETANYLKNYPLPSKEVPGLSHSFGSVGHALSVCAGVALGSPEKEICVLLSDGDMQEGSTQEAALFIRQHDIRNLHVFVDDNKIIACGATDDILRIDWEFYERNIPNFYRMNTVKGEGVSFMENDFNWHYRNLTPELLEEAIKEQNSCWD